jgi:hypothetical protein
MGGIKLADRKCFVGWLCLYNLGSAWVVGVRDGLCRVLVWLYHKTLSKRSSEYTLNFEK